MTKLLITLLFICSPLNVWALAITTTGSGNWSSTTINAPWPTGIIPDIALDTVTIAAGHTVTNDDSRTIPATTVEGTLIQGSGVTTTLGGALTIGNGASKDGALTFGAGSTLALGANNIVINNSILRSNATTSSWSVVTGTGALAKGAVYTAPKVDAVLRYVSFQTTGAVVLPVGATASGGAGLTNQLDVQHCTFNGTGAITFGVGGWMPLSTKVIIDYNDFIDLTGNITIAGIVGTPTNTVSISNNSGSFSTARNLVVQHANNFTISNNVFYGLAYASGTTGGHTFTNNYFDMPTGYTNGGSMVAGAENKAALTMQNNYFYLAFANPHPVTMSSSGGTGTHLLENNIAEVVYNTDGANVVNVGVLPIIIRNNILLGSGSLANNVGAKTGTQIDVYNNTAYLTQSIGTNGGIWLTESGSYTGTINIHSNLQVDSVSTLYGISCITATQALNRVGHNGFFNTTTKYNAVTFVTDQTATDVALAANPFKDSTRNMATWGAAIGADGTVSGARAKLLARNGYNITTKTQSDTPSNVTIAGVSTSLVDWVRAGFAPTVSSLKGTGEGGADIGAVAVYIAPISLGGKGRSFGFDLGFGF